MKKAAALIVVSYVVIYVVWGSTYFFIKQSVDTIPPFYVIAGRWLFGGLLLAIVAAATGRLRRLPTLREALSAMLLGSLLLFAGNGLITAAERTIDSYIAAMLAASTPILVALLDRVVVGRRLTLVRVLGVAVGFGGVALLLYDGRSIATSITPALLVGLIGIAAWSVGTSLGHRFVGAGDPIVLSAIQMVSVGVLALVGGLLFSGTPREALAHLSFASLVGLLYLALFGSLAFIAYTYLIAREPAERLVSYALVNPLIAVLLGIAFGGEKPTPFLALGLPLVVLGLGVMLYGERLRDALRRAPARER